MASKQHEPEPGFDHRHYVPCVRWKQGEYQAVLRLTPQAKARITPLIEVPEVGWDFETRTNVKSVQEHLAPFAKRVEQKWGHRVCFVDLKLLDSEERMSDGFHAADYVSYVFGELRELGCVAIPVTGPERVDEYQKAIGRLLRQDRRGVCLRLNLIDAASENVADRVNNLLHDLKTKPASVDLVLDLDAPVTFVPIEGFVRLLIGVVSRLPHLDEWRTFTLLGTSFPQTMGGLQVGFQSLPRHEWAAYMRMTAALSRAEMRIPTFGDYGISHPKVLRIDMRKAKPSASIRYTVDENWCILKGKNVRDNGLGQYREMCRLLSESPHFAGRSRSKGDAYIDDCARGIVNTGNLTTWRWVGTNHHIEKVVFDIASLFGA